MPLFPLSLPVERMEGGSQLQGVDREEVFPAFAKRACSLLHVLHTLQSLDGLQDILLCLSSCSSVLSVQTRGHPAVAGPQDSCGAAFPLQGCCWLAAAWGWECQAVSPCVGRPGLPRAQQGRAADGTVVFSMSYCRGFPSSAPGSVSSDGSGDRALGESSTPNWALPGRAELGVGALLTQEEPCLP